MARDHHCHTPVISFDMGHRKKHLGSLDFQDTVLSASHRPTPEGALYFKEATIKEKAKFVLATAGVALLTGAAAAPGLASTQKIATGPRPVRTQEELIPMSRAEQGAVLDPLRAVANAVETVGRSNEADIYSGVALQSTSNSVDVYVTDIEAGRRLLAEAKDLDSSIDLGLPKLIIAEYSKSALDKVADNLMAEAIDGKLPYPVYSVSVRPDGSGVEIGVPDPSTAEALSGRPQRALENRSVDALAGVKVTYIKSVGMVTS
jgi:hypothetical protein